MSTPRPTISSVVSDPDGDPVSIRARILNRRGETVWEGSSTEVPSGSVARVKVPRGILAVGSRYRVSVMASDGVLDAAAWSETQAFIAFWDGPSRATSSLICLYSSELTADN